ncbi:MAG: hypothetical protein E4H01_14405 [Lysobacterales bacterium]|nr:MAG: hypothetical protein E4H01_14405 [Xanthomonadales bacterium]
MREYVILGLMAAFGAWGWWFFSRGVQSEQKAQQDDILDKVDRAAKIRREVDAAPPGAALRELRKSWSRDVRDDKSDPD